MDVMTEDLSSADTYSKPASALSKGKTSHMHQLQRTTDAVKVTVILSNQQIVFLDRLANEIRAKNGAIVRRTELIRALVDALAQATPDVTAARSEQDLRYLFSTLLHESSARVA
jgi:hypothetical protein